MSPAFRTASAADLDLLAPWAVAFNAEEEIALPVERTRGALARLLGDVGLGVVRIATQGEDVGYAVLTWGYDLEWGGRDSFLTELWVRPDRRGAGLGRALLSDGSARLASTGRARCT